jgi:glycerol uptake facilitator-like aquaporin
MSSIHHAFILQAIEKYCKILQIRLLHTRIHQVGFISIQWLYDFTFALPVLLTGNMVKVLTENMCLVSLSRLDLVFYLFISSFILSDTALVVIYYRLVKHVREVSAHVNGSHQTRNDRDLTMVRILGLNAQLAAVGSPVLMLIIVNAIRSDLMPVKYLRIFVMVINLSLAPALIVLFWSTPALRRNVSDCRRRRRNLHSTRVHAIEHSDRTRPTARF